MKWEYETINLRDNENYMGEFDRFGEQGWELVAIGGTDGHVAFFKRPLMETP